MRLWIQMWRMSNSEMLDDSSVSTSWSQQILSNKFNKMRKSRYQPAHHTHVLQQATRMDFCAQTEGRLMTGREM
eukprot:1419478-Pyramimonas_sp.AAC.1